jgi:cytochrome P450
MRTIPGPKSSHWFYGNFKEILNAENSVIHEKWVEDYGPTFKYYSFLNIKRLCTMDTRAINHVLTHSYDYQKPEHVRYNLSQILGHGVLFVEGDKHKQQRKIMNPAFGPGQIRALTGIFMEKAIQLRDIWSSEIAKSGHEGRINVLSWLSKMTLDVIGLAGFNYEFNALNPDEKPNELNSAFATMFQAGQQLSPLPILQAWFPIFRAVPSERGRKIKAGQNTMGRIGRQLLSDSKAAIEESERGGKRNSAQRRDLLSLLVTANTSPDLLDSQRLSDEDVLAQVPTFLVAGHETTSTATTWALFALTQAPEVQTKLREELFSISTENPSMDELSTLPYLDTVVRETLRVHSPVPSTIRIAMKDDIIPLNTPFVDKNGETQLGIKVSKGDSIFIPILAMNRSKSIWGEDATQFKPERWESVPEGANHIPGIWGKQLSFLGGPRACIGYRFSIVEMKALLFTLVRAFEFELAVPAEDIGSKQTIVQRPIVITEPESGHQMPLLIKPYRP